MALNDISLTAGMRQNLVSLQGTVELLSRTQTRLATGKKVNSALDNPTAFFAAQALDARASDIDALKSDMGQAIQTIQSADKGIKGITALIEQARGIAQQAQAADATGGTGDVETISLSGVVAGNVVTIGGNAFTAVASGAAAGVGEFQVGAGGDDTATAMNLYVAVNAVNDLGGAGDVTARGLNGSVVTVGTDNGSMTAASVVTNQLTMIESAISDATGSELASLQTSYNSILTQIDNMATDSGYKGVNLLASATLTVKFETGTLAVTGFDGSSTGADLGLSSASWANPAAAAGSVTELEGALGTLRSKSSAMSANLSIITTRQSFSSDMINTLTEGSGKLTLADTNEEGANMLMLQTRQSLSTTALSLASQAAQSVLRLFG